MSSTEAEAKTSAGAPCRIWVARAPDDPKLNAAVAPGWMAWNADPSWSNAPVSDEAADTVIDPDSRVEVVVVEELAELPQAAPTIETETSTIPLVARQPHRLRRP